MTKLSERYSQLLLRIATHAKDAGRDPASIRIVAITKYCTSQQMQEAYELGIRDFGENRLQTAIPKIAQLPSDVCWHFIGPLQSNKVGKIIHLFDSIHSVDSLEVAQMIAKKSNELQRQPAVFLQVNTSGEANKQGFSESEVMNKEISDLGLNLIGLMTMAPLTSDMHWVRACFSRLRILRDQLYPTLPHLSMGMSQDFPVAIAEGATYLRIGSYLFR